MQQDPDLADLLDSTAEEGLLEEGAQSLPQSVGHPEPMPPNPTRARLVGFGATLTGLTLVIGCLLIALGAIDAITRRLGVLSLGAVLAGVALVATHWGWVHVAEAAADAIESRRNSATLARRRQWLKAIEPYARHEVSTSVGEDGSITIVQLRHRPVRSGDRSFKFVREIEATEAHSGDEPAAVVAERAELLRRQAAMATERERRRYELALEAHRGEMLGDSDEAERLAARRAAANALSEQINSRLRDPPLTE